MISYSHTEKNKTRLYWVRLVLWSLHGGLCHCPERGVVVLRALSAGMRRDPMSLSGYLVGKLPSLIIYRDPDDRGCPETGTRQGRLSCHVPRDNTHHVILGRSLCHDVTLQRNWIQFGKPVVFVPDSPSDKWSHLRANSFTCCPACSQQNRSRIFALTRSIQIRSPTELAVPPSPDPARTLWTIRSYAARIQTIQQSRNITASFVGLLAVGYVSRTGDIFSGTKYVCQPLCSWTLLQVTRAWPHNQRSKQYAPSYRYTL